MAKKQDTIVEQHIKALEALKGWSVEAGWFESARYPAAKGKSVGVSVAQVARINEFGAVIKRGKATIVIPPRPFMRGAYANIKQKMPEVQKKIASQLMAGKIKPEQALKQIGLFMEGEIVLSIKNGGWVKNAPSTAKRKGFNTPLIHTGHMWQSVVSKVSEPT